mgnify:CR=1 FL=1
MFVVSRHLKPERVILDMEVNSREEAIKGLAECLRGAAEVKDFEGFVQDVLRREKQGSTAVGMGVAIPHARTDKVQGVVVAVGRLMEPIKWPSPDSQPVRLLFLMGTCTKIVARYIQIVAHLTRILRHSDFREKLLKAATAEELVRLFLSEERADK